MLSLQVVAVSLSTMAIFVSFSASARAVYTRAHKPILGPLEPSLNFHATGRCVTGAFGRNQIALAMHNCFPIPSVMRYSLPQAPDNAYKRRSFASFWPRLPRYGACLSRLRVVIALASRVHCRGLRPYRLIASDVRVWSSRSAIPIARLVGS